MSEGVEKLFDGEASVRDDERFADVYGELREIARREHRRNPAVTLNTTALVHEAWLKLRERGGDWNDRDHFLAVAALAMRHVLVDYARYRAAGRRDAAREIPLIESAIPASTTAGQLLAIDSALDELESLEPRLARLVLLRFFGGLSLEQAGRGLDISPRTAARDWVEAAMLIDSQDSSINAWPSNRSHGRHGQGAHNSPWVPTASTNATQAPAKSE